MIEAHKQYKVHEKPAWNEKKLDNESLHNNISTKLKINKRKAWTPPSGLTLHDIDQAWEKLGEAEKDRG